VARNAQRLKGKFPGAEVIEGDLFDEGRLRYACTGVTMAYYLIHSMADAPQFAARDRDGAALFATVARECGVRRIIYLGGLGADEARLSTHLRSRHEVGDVLRANGPQTIEFRAAMIIGAGSVSFEMMRYLTERLPVMIAPKWVTTRSQPIAIDDVLRYLVAALELRRDDSMIYEIGGADIVTYRDMMLRYARLRHLNRTIIIVPFFTPRLSSYWVHLVTPVSARFAQPLILGLHNEAVVRNTNAMADFAATEPIGFDAAVLRALDRYRAPDTKATWFDAFEARAPSGKASRIYEGMLVDRRDRVAAATPHDVASVFTRLGGERGWLYGNALWNLRGFFDRVIGGVGLRRGRRSATEVRLGDAIDFWRVEAYEPDRLLRLRAEMKLPGKAWLEFRARPLGAGRTGLTQTAFFEPRGVWGLIYWYTVAPFHGLIFGRMASRIALLAERGARISRASGSYGRGE